MAHFMYQLDGAMGSPDTESAAILGVSMKVFLDEIGTWIKDWVKQIALPVWVGLT